MKRHNPRLHIDNLKPVILLSVFFGLICLGPMNYAGVSFAQGLPSEENGPAKEELKLESGPSLNNEDGKMVEAPALALENMAPQKEEAAVLAAEQTAAQPEEKFSLTAKDAAGKRETEDKSVFGRELGMIGISVKTDKRWGVLSLDDCIAIAMKNHLPLQIARKSIKLAEMRVFEARRNMLPSASINFEEGDGRVNGRKYISRKQFVEGQQPVFHGGELFFTMKQAETNLQITRNDYEKIKNDLILQVKKGYYTLAKAKGNLKMQEALSDEVSRIYDMVKREFEASVTSKLEYLNVTSQASQTRYQLTSAEGDFSIAGLILKQAMNIDPRDDIEINEGLVFKKVEVDFQKALAAAFLNRPEMKMNALMIDYYNYGKGIARAKGFPKIDILGHWGLAKDEYTSQDATASDDRKMWQQWYAGVKGSMPFWGSTGEVSWVREQWPPVVSTYHSTESNTTTYKFKILDKLDYYSDKKLAEIDFDKARQELNKIRQDIVLEVREGCFNYNKALLQSEAALCKVSYQEKDLEVTRMKRGMEEALDSNVIETMIKVAQEKFGYLQALTDCHISLAAINKAIGMEDYFKDT